MVRSAVAAGGGHAQQDGYDAARLSKATTTTTTAQRLPVGVGAVSLRIVLVLVVVLLSLGVLIPIVNRSKNDALAVAQSVPRLPRTANLHLGQVNWKRYTLRQAAQAVAMSDGVLIVCTVSQPYLEFLNNWLISLAKQNRHQAALIIAEDYSTLEYVNSRWPGHAVLIPPALNSATPSLRFGSQGFFNLTSRRPQYLLEILNLGYSVLYNDVDVVWLADPFSYFENKRDVYITDDMAVLKPEDHSHALPPPGKKGRTYICSCMLFLRPTEGAKLLMRAWMKELEERPWSPTQKANDQPAFNWALNHTSGQVDVYLLPQVAFPSGGLYFKNETWRKETANKHVIVHNNYVVGFEQKIKRFRNHNLWFVEVDAGLSPLSEKGG